MGVVGSETEGNLVNVKFSVFLLLVSSLFIMRSLILLSKERAILYPLRYSKLVLKSRLSVIFFPASRRRIDLS